MKINGKNARKLFLEYFPSGEGYDFADRRMLVNHYGRSDLETGWNIDHKLALCRGGTNNKGNLQCTNIKTNLIKRCKTSWEDEGKIFQVRKNKNDKNAYEIIKVDERKSQMEYNLSEKEIATKLFLEKFPSGVGVDFTGRTVILEDFLNKEVESGWKIVKLNPLNKKIGFDKNYDILNLESASEKGNKTSWFDGERYWQIQKIQGIYKVLEVIHENGDTFIKGV